jgi:hypothetical protein
MSGATVAYNLRQNKHVERQVFIELISLFERWQTVRNYLYVGFGGVYFEDYKLLHTSFGIDKMISLEVEPWMVPRQMHNIPFECIEPRRQKSNEFISEVDEQRAAYNVDNILVWLDYATARELADQLTEVRALVPKLIPGDLLKVTLPLSTKWLDGYNYPKRFERRLESLKNKLGSTYLPDGLTLDSVQDEVLPDLYLGTLRRAIAEGMAENAHAEFLPLGCYTYADGARMLTVTGAIVSRTDAPDFAKLIRLSEFDLSSPNWELHEINVPDLSLRERLQLDDSIYTRQSGVPAATCDITEIAEKLGFQLAAKPEESLKLIENYVKLYRYYPSYHRVQL